MANEYAVNSADLKAIADAIRAKVGQSGALAFPAGFVDAVDAIQTGSGNLYEEGVLIGSGAALLKIPISFEPDMLYIIISGDETSESNHLYSGVLIRDTMGQTTHRNANTTTISNGGYQNRISGMMANTNNAMVYENGVAQWTLSSSARTPANGREYKWKAVKWT